MEVRHTHTVNMLDSTLDLSSKSFMWCKPLCTRQELSLKLKKQQQKNTTSTETHNHSWYFQHVLWSWLKIQKTMFKKKKNVWTSLFPFSWLTWTAACQLKQVCLHPSQAPCVHVRYPLHRDPLRIQSLCRHQPLETWGSPRGCVWCTSWLARAWLSASSWWEDKFRTDCKCFCALCCHLSSTVSF